MDRKRGSPKGSPKGSLTGSLRGSPKSSPSGTPTGTPRVYTPRGDGAQSPPLPKRPRSLKEKKKQLGWDLPTLQIPQAQAQAQSPRYFYNPNAVPYVAGVNIPQSAVSTNPSLNNPYLYPRKASQFMFNQFNGLRDFTMGTAKAGLGIGEKSAFWIYNKVSSWSKKWFTHIFLSLVILIYTIGGAVMFVAIEGKLKKK